MGAGKEMAKFSEDVLKKAKTRICNLVVPFSPFPILSNGYPIEMK